jgi:hypothetical protein
MADDPVDPAVHRRLAIEANNSVWELLDDFDLGCAHEARARALAGLGRLDEAAADVASARAVEVVDVDDRQLFEDDLAAEPWFGLPRNG